MPAKILFLHLNLTNLPLIFFSSISMKESWLQTKAQLEVTLPTHTFNTWIKPLEYKSSENQKITLEVPNAFYRDRIQKTYATLIKAKLRQLSQNADADIIFSVAEQNQDTTQQKLETLSKSKTDSIQKQSSSKNKEGLNDKYTFNSFVVGNNSQFAHAAALSVADSPGSVYNPLYIYGGVGLGKTHLLHAIGNHISENKPNYKIVYRSSEQFMNQLINAIRFQKTDEFRTQFRQSCDVLLVDDIQFLAGKERTQEEFFHTFNTLHQANIQIVMTSDKMPKEIQDLDDRLRSRFEWGLFCDIQPPDIETRIAILRKKAESCQTKLPDDVAQFLASKIKSNVRALEGALVRLFAFTSLSKQPLSLELAKTLLGGGTSEDQKLNIETVQKKVAEFYNIQVADLKSARRHKPIALPRQIAMYLCRKLTQDSFPTIGEQFGGKDHTTVMHAVSKIEALQLNDLRIRNTLNALESNLSL